MFIVSVHVCVIHLLCVDYKPTWIEHIVMPIMLSIYYVQIMLCASPTYLSPLLYTKYIRGVYMLYQTIYRYIKRYTYCWIQISSNIQIILCNIIQLTLSVYIYTHTICIMFISDDISQYIKWYTSIYIICGLLYQMIYRYILYYIDWYTMVYKHADRTWYIHIMLIQILYTNMLI